MKLKRIIYRPSAYVQLSREEVLLLRERARKHYDSACREVTQPGGFIYGWWNRLDSGLLEWVEVDATFEQLDVCAKITEMEHDGAGHKLHRTLRETLLALNASSTKVNA